MLNLFRFISMGLKLFSKNVFCKLLLTCFMVFQYNATGSDSLKDVISCKVLFDLINIIKSENVRIKE